MAVLVGKPAPDFTATAVLGNNEMLRVVDALQFTEEHGEVCPAGWRKGQEGVTETPEGVARYLAHHAGEL